MSMEQLLPYYESELGYLRRNLREFAERYPRIAGRLLISGEVCEDPHTERMIESFALLNARIARRQPHCIRADGTDAIALDQQINGRRHADFAGEVEDVNVAEQRAHRDRLRNSKSRPQRRPRPSSAPVRWSACQTASVVESRIGMPNSRSSPSTT